MIPAAPYPPSRGIMQPNWNHATELESFLMDHKLLFANALRFHLIPFLFRIRRGRILNSTERDLMQK